jgi:hypothetical protein
MDWHLPSGSAVVGQDNGQVVELDAAGMVVGEYEGTVG